MDSSSKSTVTCNYHNFVYSIAENSIGEVGKAALLKAAKEIGIEVCKLQ